MYRKLFVKVIEKSPFLKCPNRRAKEREKEVEEKEKGGMVSER